LDATTNNPYAPPKSNVGTGSRRAIETRPAQVTYAVWLLWLAIALNIPVAIYEYGRQVSEMDVQGLALIVTYVLVFGFAIAITISIGRGRNWARLVFLVSVTLVFVSIPPVLPQFLTYPASQLTLNASLLAIELAVVYLLFTHPGSLWFRRID
jgi:hypothetical protein